LVECGRHLNVEILTLSEIVDVSGRKGDFTVTVRKKPRYIDMDKCIACGLCAQKCPKKVDDEFNMGISKRKAAYIQYGQTVPLKYVIDPEHCLYLTKGKCRACEKFCPTGAINFDDREERVTLNVGAMILSPGYRPFDPSGMDYYGYDQVPDVVTSLEYERMLSASGPFQGHLVKPSDHREPKKIAWIQCVGSRNTNRCDNGYCSSVCCMYAVKQALVTAEHLTGEGLQQTIFYMDIRSHGKEFERYYEDAIAKKVNFVRARPHTIDPGVEGSGVSMTYTLEDGTQTTENFDLAVLSVGLEASPEAIELSERLGIALDEHRFARTRSFWPVTSSRDGIYVSGAFQAPMAIPRSVTQASTAAAEAGRALIEAKGTLTRTKTYPKERNIENEAPRIGVFVCSCGINIANVVDVEAVAQYAEGLPHVVLVENNLFTCSTDTQSLIAEKIKEHDLNRIVVAACTPRTHEPLFQDTLKEAGLNGHLVEMANIRNQNAWVHQKQPEMATEKAKDQVRMAVARSSMAYGLEAVAVDVEQKALVIGGGVSGMKAALMMAGQGFPVLLIEKSDRLGGVAAQLRTTAQGEAVRPLLEKLIRDVEANDRIDISTRTTLVSAAGSVGNFSGEIDVDGNRRAVSFGAAVVATGGKESVPDEYGYGTNDRILTHLQLDALLDSRPEALQQANSAVFIQCVGSRDARRPYCSRVCCTHSVESAIELKTRNPHMNVYVLYRDMRTYGTREALYARARQMGVVFIRFDLEDKPRVSTVNGNLAVRVNDPVLQMPLEIRADYLILAAAIEPTDNADLVDIFKFSVNPEKFVNEAHPKLRPVDMSVEGLFVAGLCNYPKPIDEAVAQAKAAASRANVILSQATMQLDPIKSTVTDACDGCALCLDVCPYKAIGLVEKIVDGTPVRRVVTDSALCKGCGICEATCPKGGIVVHGFTPDQLKVQVQAALEPVRQRAVETASTEK
jgi:heterodisulfide reductase subunit A2